MSSNVTLDLNGHSYTYTGTSLFDVFQVKGSGSFKIVDNSGIGGTVVGGNGNTTICTLEDSQNASISIGKGVTVKGHVLLTGTGPKLEVLGTIDSTGNAAAAIQNNGSSTDGSIIDIKDGATVTGDHTAIYHPGTGTLSVHKATVTGGSVGIEMRKGTLNVYDGASITGGSGTPSSTANGSGSTTNNAAIAVAQHGNSTDPVKINIEGGTLTGGAALYESNPHGNGTASTNEITMSVTGGDLVGAVHSETKTGFVTGGSVAVTGLEQIKELDGCLASKNSVKVSLADPEGSLSLSEPVVLKNVNNLSMDVILSDNAASLTLPSGSTVTIEADSSLTGAKFTAITDEGSGTVMYCMVVTVTFYSDSEMTGSATQDIPCGVETALNSNTFSLTGHTFTGWNTSADGTGDEYDDCQEVSLAAALTLYAQWAADMHTVTFMNGDATVLTGQYAYGQAVEGPAEPSRTGYGFLGWFDSGDKEWTLPFNVTDDITLHAAWEACTYTVAFDANGGSGTMSSTSMTYDVPSTLASNTFTRTGYTFDGWNTAADGSGTSYSDGEQVSNLSSVDGATVTLYAQWTANSYTIEFDANGGTGGMSPVSMTYDVSSTLASNAFSRTGYTFAGWNTAANGSGTPYSNGGQVSSLSSVDGAIITLYAQWDILEFALSFDANGGTGTMDSIEADYGSEVEVPFNAFARTGYTFAGWNTAADGSGTSCEAGETLEITGNTTIYAQWAANRYTIVFDPNTGTGEMPGMEMTYDVPAELDAVGFEHLGYVFDGWNTSADGSGAGYGDCEEVFNLASEDGSEVVLYAIWKADRYTVAFDANGGEGEMEPQSMTYDVSVALTADAFTRTGYTFAGWNTAADGSGTAYADGEVVSNLATENDVVITFYAQWSPITYTVAFDANGGDGGMSGQPMTYDVSVALSSNAFTKAGHDFAGWNTSADATGTAYADGAEVSNLSAEDGATVILYAQWDIIAYAVSFDANGGEGEMDDIVADYGTPVTLTACTFVRTGYSFAGWNTAADGNGTGYADEGSLEIAGELILYAQWSPVSYTVSFDANGGAGEMADIEMVYDVPAALPSNAFARTGCTFEGWNTVADGSGTAYADGAEVSNLTAEGGATVILHAQWERTVVTDTVTETDPDTGASSETVKETVVNDDGSVTETVTVTDTDANGDVTETVTETTTSVTETEEGTVTETVTDVSDSEGNTLHSETVVTETVTEDGKVTDTVSMSTSVDASGVETVVGTESRVVEEDGTVSESTATTILVQDADGNELSVTRQQAESVTDASGNRSYTSYSVTVSAIEGGKLGVAVSETGDAGSVTTERVVHAWSDDGRVTTTVEVDDTDIRTMVVDAVDTVDDELANLAVSQSASVAEVLDDSYGRTIQVTSGTQVGFTSGAMEAIAGSGATLTVVCLVGSMEMDGDVVATLSEPGHDVTVTMSPADAGSLTPAQVEEMDSAYGIVMTADVGDERYHQLGGTVTVTLPYVPEMGPDPSVLAAYHISDDGAREALETSYDPEAGAFTFSTVHFSLFVIDEEETVIPPFILDDDDRPVIVPPAVVPTPSEPDSQDGSDDMTAILACAAAAAFAVLLALLAVSYRRK